MRRRLVAKLVILLVGLPSGFALGADRSGAEQAAREVLAGRRATARAVGALARNRYVRRAIHDGAVLIGYGPQTSSTSRVGYYLKHAGLEATCESHEMRGGEWMWISGYSQHIDGRRILHWLKDIDLVRPDGTKVTAENVDGFVRKALKP